MAADKNHCEKTSVSSVDYELILEKIPTDDKDLARVKSLLLLELQFSVEEALSILSSMPIVIATSEDEKRLESVASRFLEAGAEVSIKKKLLRTDNNTVDIIDEIEFPGDEPFNHDVADQDLNVIDLALEENLEDILRQFQEQESASQLKEDQDQDIFMLDDASSLEFMDFRIGEFSEESSNSFYENLDSDNQLSASPLFELVDDSGDVLNTSGQESTRVDSTIGNQKEVETKLSGGITFELEESVEPRYLEEKNDLGNQNLRDLTPSGAETVQSELPGLELVNLQNELSLDGSPQIDMLVSFSHESCNQQPSDAHEAGQAVVNDQGDNDLFQGAVGDPDPGNQHEGFLKRREPKVIVETKPSEPVKQDQSKPVLVYILVAAVLFFGILNVLNLLNDHGDDFVFEPATNQITQTTKLKNVSQSPSIKEPAILSLVNEQSHVSVEIKQLNETAFLVSLLLKDFPKVDLNSPVIKPELLNVSWIDSLRASGVVERDIRKGFSIPGRLVVRDARALQRFESRAEAVFEEFVMLITINFGNQTITRSFDLDQKAARTLQDLFKHEANKNYKPK